MLNHMCFWIRSLQAISIVCERFYCLLMQPVPCKTHITNNLIPLRMMLSTHKSSLGIMTHYQWYIYQMISRVISQSLLVGLGHLNIKARTCRIHFPIMNQLMSNLNHHIIYRTLSHIQND